MAIGHRTVRRDLASLPIFTGLFVAVVTQAHITVYKQIINDVNDIVGDYDMASAEHVTTSPVL